MSTTVVNCVVLSAHALVSQREELLSSVFRCPPSLVCVPSAEAGAGLWRPSPALSFSVYHGLLLVSVFLVASSGGSDEVYALHEEVIRVACSLVSFVARKPASLSALSHCSFIFNWLFLGFFKGE
ncbi:BnaC06g26800D [Brassica napus]|uniref:BnaC06g26800D protein n=1 Tax=Brassica napus TaxID=3708 RepID=A0A078GUV8_BRANA|nr:BnaC06g26800D [Brassica napus]